MCVCSYQSTCPALLDSNLIVSFRPNLCKGQLNICGVAHFVLLQIVVATPGRLWELMQEGHAHLTDMSGLNFFVLDEADRMVQQGHFQVITVPALMLLCFAHSTALSIHSVLLVSHGAAKGCLSITFQLHHLYLDC